MNNRKLLIIITLLMLCMGGLSSVLASSFLGDLESPKNTYEELKGDETQLKLVDIADIGYGKEENLVGSEQYPIGIDLNLSFRLNDFKEGTEGIKVYFMYQAFSETNSVSVNSQSIRRGKILLGHCEAIGRLLGTSFTSENYDASTDQCFMSVPNVYVPDDINDIIIQVVAYDGNKVMLDVQEYIVSVVDELPPNVHFMIQRAGVLSISSGGPDSNLAVHFQSYEKPKMRRPLLTTTCEPDGCSVKPLDIRKNDKEGQPYCNVEQIKSCGTKFPNDICKDVLDLCARSMQIVGNTELNRKYANEALVVGYKISHDNYNRLTFAALGENPWMGRYHYTSVYYFPIWADEVSVAFGDDYALIDISNVPNTKDFHALLMFDNKNNQIKYHIGIPRDDLEHAGTRRIKKEGKESQYGSLHSLTGNSQYPFGIDLNLSAHIYDYTVQSDLDEVYQAQLYVYFKTSQELYGEVNHEKWRDKIHVGGCLVNNNDMYGHLTLNDQCIMEVSRIFVPKGTHEIIFVTELNGRKRGVKGIDSITKHCLIPTINDNELLKEPVKYGAINYNSGGTEGLCTFQKYRIASYEKYLSARRSNATQFCQWPQCHTDPLSD